MIVAKSGRYGPYVTEILPDDAPKNAKPRTGSLFKSMSLETVATCPGPAVAVLVPARVCVTEPSAHPTHSPTAIDACAVRDGWLALTLTRNRSPAMTSTVTGCPPGARATSRPKARPELRRSSPSDSGGGAASAGGVCTSTSSSA